MRLQIRCFCFKCCPRAGRPFTVCQLCARASSCLPSLCCSGRREELEAAADNEQPALVSKLLERYPLSSGKGTIGHLSTPLSGSCEPLADAAGVRSTVTIRCSSRTSPAAPTALAEIDKFTRLFTDHILGRTHVLDVRAHGADPSSCARARDLLERAACPSCLQLTLSVSALVSADGAPRRGRLCHQHGARRRRPCWCVQSTRRRRLQRQWSPDSPAAL